MSKQNSNNQNKAVNKVFLVLSAIATLLLLIIGGLALWAHNYTTEMVKTELSGQKIYFPEKGSLALDPEEFPDLQQYAGQLVDTAPEARAYANGFIGRHLKKVAEGKTYAEVSAAVQKDPTNAELQKQKQTLFQGEILRGMLLGNGFAFGTMGQIAKVFADISFILSGITLIATFIFAKRMGRR